MKRQLTILVALMCASAFARKHVESEALAASPWADTEATTNICFAPCDGPLCRIDLSLEFDATPSNNVQVAFGRDADGDGALGLDEQALTVGWDCGGWLVRGETNDFARTWMESVAGAAAGTNAHRRVELTGLAHESDWDLVRVTVRGVDGARERFVVETTKIGTTILVR